jgi:hypothetical protein
MSTEDDVTRHATELARLTAAAWNSPTLPEEEVARLGMMIATERQLLIDAVGALLLDDDPEAAAMPGVAEFDAGFRYGLEFARVIDEAKLSLERQRRSRVLKFARGRESF